MYLKMENILTNSHCTLYDEWCCVYSGKYGIYISVKSVWFDTFLKKFFISMIL